MNSDTGLVTLLKSGKTTISVQTGSNDRYNSNKASYNLTVNKADPHLKIGNIQPITAKWADEKSHKISVTFGNPDAESMTTRYKSENIEVVTVDKSGNIRAIKPGTAVISVNTPETDQFKAASGEVTYVLNKGDFKINFEKAEISTTDEDMNFRLQKPLNQIPSNINFTWKSTPKNVVNLSPQGKVQGKIQKGRATVSLCTADNDFYNKSCGSYDVLFYGKPNINIGEITYSSKGSSNDKGVWIPVYQYCLKFQFGYL